MVGWGRVVGWSRMSNGSMVCRSMVNNRGRVVSWSMVNNRGRPVSRGMVDYRSSMVDWSSMIGRGWGIGSRVTKYIRSCRDRRRSR